MLLVGAPTVGYVESLVILLSLAKHAGIHSYPVMGLVQTIWYPVDWSCRHFAVVQSFYDLQLDTIDLVLNWLGRW